MWQLWDWRELRLVLALALPIVIGQLAQTGMGFMDTLMAGQVSAEDLAGVALGSAVWLPIYLFSSGVLLLLTPKVAASLGANAPEQAMTHLYQASIIAVMLALLSSVVLWASAYWMSLFTLEAKVHQVATEYLHYLILGIWVGLAFQVLRFWFDGFSLTHYAMWLSLLGFLVNIPLNYAFVYGWWWIPSLGGAGCGIATSLSYLVMAIMGGWLFYVQHRQQGEAYQASHATLLSLVLKWRETTIAIVGWLAKGVPIAAAILFEVGLFIVVAFLLTPLGTTVLAAHQIAISYTSLVFMLPLSLAMAMTVRIGFLQGQQDMQQLHRAVFTLLLFAIGLGSVLSLLTWWFHQAIANAYNDDYEVVALAGGLILLSGLYQVSDAMQVFFAGVLRGMMDTVSVMWVTLVAYWLIALPLGYWLCYEQGFGVAGFWISFIVGLTLAALGLGWRVYGKLTRYE